MRLQPNVLQERDQVSWSAGHQRLLPLGGQLAEPLTELLHCFVTALDSVNLSCVRSGSLGTMQSVLVHLLGCPGIQLLCWGCLSM